MRVVVLPIVAKWFCSGPATVRVVHDRARKALGYGKVSLPTQSLPHYSYDAHARSRKESHHDDALTDHIRYILTCSRSPVDHGEADAWRQILQGTWAARLRTGPLPGCPHTMRSGCSTAEQVAVRRSKIDESAGGVGRQDIQKLTTHQTPPASAYGPTWITCGRMFLDTSARVRFTRARAELRILWAWILQKIRSDHEKLPVQNSDLGGYEAS